MKPYPVKLGQIANISEDGLAFVYLGETQISYPYTHLDLYVTCGDKAFSSFPIKLLGFVTVATIYGAVPIQRVSICFKGLTDKQKEQIRRFILQYAE